MPVLRNTSDLRQVSLVTKDIVEELTLFLHFNN